MKLVRGCCVSVSSERLRSLSTHVKVLQGNCLCEEICLYFTISLLVLCVCVCFLVSEGEDALPNGLDVTFEVTELRRLTGNYNTMVGNNEGSMVSALKG